MKQIIACIVLAILVYCNNSTAQTYYATIKIDDVDISSSNIGDEIIVPITLVNKSYFGTILEIAFQLHFDQTYLTWLGPTNGVQNFHTNLPMPDWYFDLYASQITAWWSGWDAISMSNGDIFFELVFTYNGGLSPGNSSLITWNSGASYMAYPPYEPFDLTLYDGSVYRVPEPQLIELNASVFLEGPFSNNQMVHDLNDFGYLPLDQPYDTDPWNYPGIESVVSIPGANIVDWVLVDILKLHTKTSHQYFTIQDRKVGFLFDDGTITGINGSALLSFSIMDTSNCYARIHHRNHLSATSSKPLEKSDNVYIYDFTKDSIPTITGSYSQKKIFQNIWGLIASDGNSSNQIDNCDKNDVWINYVGETGYLKSDFNLDGQVNNDDYLLLWKNNSGTGLVVREYRSCGDILIDARDGINYTTVLIGDQCWMAENLNIGQMIYGPVDPSDNGILEKYCYDNNSTNCDTYGGLYQWNEMMQYITDTVTQGICPIGWHLPTNTEWTILTNYLGGLDIAGGKMKEQGTDHWNSPNTGATNESGFTAIAGGYRHFSAGSFAQMGHSTNYWSSSTWNVNYAWNRIIYTMNNSCSVNHYGKTYGLSVRCIKD